MGDASDQRRQGDVDVGLVELDVDGFRGDGPQQVRHAAQVADVVDEPSLAHRPEQGVVRDGGMHRPEWCAIEREDGDVGPVEQVHVVSFYPRKLPVYDEADVVARPLQAEGEIYPLALRPAGRQGMGDEGDHVARPQRRPFLGAVAREQVVEAGRSHGRTAVLDWVILQERTVPRLVGGDPVGHAVETGRVGRCEAQLAVPDRVAAVAVAADVVVGVADGRELAHALKHHVAVELL